MQPRSLPVDAARELDLGDGALGEGELAFVADPHAAVNSATAPSTTAFLIIVRTAKPPAPRVRER
jgi:hypothetical protein